MNRQEQIDKLNSIKEFDICIIGGGATGLGIAVDAASTAIPKPVAPPPMMQMSNSLIEFSLSICSCLFIISDLPMR